MVDRTITATVDAAPAVTMTALSDLGTYPDWLTLVTAADRVDNDPNAWLVTLRARLGPLARSKRLRMVRTRLDDNRVTFERAETDNRQHAAWILEADLEEVTPGTCEVNVRLHYGGALWSTPLEMVLSSFEGSAAERLSFYLAGR